MKTIIVLFQETFLVPFSQSSTSPVLFYWNKDCFNNLAVTLLGELFIRCRYLHLMSQIERALEIILAHVGYFQ